MEKTNRVWVDNGVFSGWVSVEPVVTEVIDCNISDEVFLRVAKQAHAKNITFNQMVIEILEEQIKNQESGDVPFWGEDEPCEHKRKSSYQGGGWYCTDCKEILA